MGDGDDPTMGRSTPAERPPSWHPEPELIDFRDPARARAVLEALGEAGTRAALDWLYGEAVERPVLPGTYSETRRAFFGEASAPGRAPLEPSGSRDVLEEFRERLVPYLFSAYHPASLGYFTPPPLPVAMLGDHVAQWLNQGVDIWHGAPAATLIEEEVVAWLRDLVGFDGEGWGVLTSGGVMANIMALAAARDVGLARLRGSAGPPRGRELEGARVYASDQAHFSIARALDILGFPDDALRILPSDDRFRLHGDVVADAAARDRAAGFLPFAIAAVSGSTNTGSVDLVGELADVAEREDLWLHVDAAYGGAVRLSARHAGRVSDLERADSVTIDPHKWFFQPYDIGALIVRRRGDLQRTFHRAPEYYRHADDEPLNWYQYSIEGTRRFRGLKLWMSWKHLGTEGFARLIERTLDLAAYLAGRLAGGDVFEAVPEEPELSVVCFRHLPGGREAAARLDPASLDRHQDLLQRALAASGRGWLSTTKLRGRTYLRAGLMNYMSTEEDIDRLLEALVDLSTSLPTVP